MTIAFPARRLPPIGAALMILCAACTPLPPPAQPADHAAAQAPDAPANANTPQLQAKIAFDIATRERAAGDNATAVNFYRNAMALDPAMQPSPAIALGDALLTLDRPDQAAEAYRIALTDTHRSAAEKAQAQIGLGVAQLSLGQTDAAILSLQAGMTQSSQARAYRALAVAEDLQAHFQAAQATCAEGFKIFPYDQGLREDLGFSQALAGNFPAAIATLRAAAAAPGASSRDQLNLALVLGWAGQDAEAEQIAGAILGAAAAHNNAAFYSKLRQLPPIQAATLIFKR